MGSFEEYLKKSYVFNQDLGYWSRSGRGEFMYSDGDEVENRILSIIQRAGDLSSNSIELGQECTDWPSTYHLSAMRSNLLRPISAALKGRILEVGAGLGAMTRFLGEQGGEILALEGSPRRAAAIQARCRDLKNVTVLADSFHEFDAINDFDVVVLIGVLEYARKFFVSDQGDPVDAMLKHARGLLRPGGVLILAIENQLGLKYFAGCPEDHTGIPMYGIEDLYGDDTVVTFGQIELTGKLKRLGFPEQNWWFPFPDYKLPDTVLSSNVTEQNVELTPLLIHSVGVDLQNLGNQIFSLEQTWGLVLRNGLVHSLSNSFLILASDVHNAIVLHDKSVLGYYFSVNRRPEFAKEIIFERSGSGKVTARKRALFPQSLFNENSLLSIELKNEEFLEGINWQNQLCHLLNKPGWTLKDVEAWASVWFAALLKHGNIALENQKNSSQQMLPGDLFDAVPRNLIVTKESGPRFFDQEWHLKVNIELGYLMFRGIYLELINPVNIARPVDGTPLNVFMLFKLIVQSLGMEIADEDLVRYATFESDILAMAAGKKSWLTPGELMSRSLAVRVSVSDKTKDEQIASLTQELKVITQSRAWRFVQLIGRLRHGKIGRF